MSLLIESQYLLPVATFSLLKNSNGVIFDHHSHYIKGSYRNRCHIGIANGVQRLTVPLVKGKHQKTPLGEVRISYDENWQKDHWQSIISAYGRSAFFDFYRDSFEDILFRKFDRLVDLNDAFFNWLVEELAMDIACSFTKEYIEPNQTGDLIDRRDHIHPQEQKMKIAYTPKPYEQVFTDKQPFLPNLSIIDLLFTQGPMAKQFL